MRLSSRPKRKRPRSDTAALAADDKHDDERPARGSKRVATNASGHGGAARSGHAPADGGNAAGWSGEPSTCDDGVDASLQSSGIGGSDERIPRDCIPNELEDLRGAGHGRGGRTVHQASGPTGRHPMPVYLCRYTCPEGGFSNCGVPLIEIYMVATSPA